MSPDEDEVDASLHPALLDACLHLFPALSGFYGDFREPPEGEGVTFLPINVEGFRILGPAPADVLLVLLNMSESRWGATHQVTVGLQLACATVLALADLQEEAAERIDGYLAKRRGADVRPGQLLIMREQIGFVVMKDAMAARPEVGREFLHHLVNDMRDWRGTRPEGMIDVLEEVAKWMIKYGFDADAVPLCQELLSLARTHLPDGRDGHADMLIHISGAQTRLDRLVDAEQSLREALQIRQEIYEPENWLIASAKSMLGETLIDQQRYEEAEPLVLEGYEGMRGALEVPEIRPREALERIVKLYEQWDKPDQAAEWRAKLNQLGGV